MGGVAGGQEGIFARVPAKEVRGVSVLGMGFAGGPDFVEKKSGGAFGGAVQVVDDATVFFAGGANEGAEFGFEEHFLAVARAQLNDQGDGFFGKLGALSRFGFA